MAKLFGCPWLDPCKTKYTNHYIKREDSPKDFPAIKTRDEFISIWHCSSLIHRLKFLFNGRMQITIAAQKQPSIGVRVYEK